jgi:hypothetical protein
MKATDRYAEGGADTVDFIRETRSTIRTFAGRPRCSVSFESIVGRGSAFYAGIASP